MTLHVMVQVAVKGCILSYGELKAMGHFGIFKQWLCKDKASDLNGKTGSWERLLKVAHIGHTQGPTPGYIAASVSNFIGFWASATGDIETIGMFDQQCCILLSAVNNVKPQKSMDGRYLNLQ